MWQSNIRLFWTTYTIIHFCIFYCILLINNFNQKSGFQRPFKFSFQNKIKHYCKTIITFVTISNSSRTGRGGGAGRGGEHWNIIFLRGKIKQWQLHVPETKLPEKFTQILTLAAHLYIELGLFCRGPQYYDHTKLSQKVSVSQCATTVPLVLKAD